VVKIAWCHICLEAFCLYGPSKNKEEEMFELVNIGENGFESKSLGIRPNSVYIDAERPEFCKNKYEEDESEMTPCPDCMMNDCKFLGTCPVERKEAHIMVEAWEKASERGEFDFLESGKSTDGGDV